MSDETSWTDSEEDSLPIVKIESQDAMDIADDDGLAGALSNVQIAAVFSEAHRFRRTAPVATTWDETSDSESEAEIIGTIHRSDQPWFDAHECKVVRELALDELLDEFEDAYDLDVPLKLRPFMAKFQAKAVEELRQRLADRVATEFLLSDVPGSARRPEFDDWNQDVIFPVKRQRAGSRPSDSPEF
jgi:hypothetical protein